MILDEDFVSEGLIKAETCLYQGVSLNEYSREELIAIAVEGWMMYSKKLAESRSSMNLMRDLYNAKDRKVS